MNDNILMNENNNYPKEKGLSINTKAPEFSTTDVDGKKIVLKEILQNYNGLLIDFFRGAW